MRQRLSLVLALFFAVVAMAAGSVWNNSAAGAAPQSGSAAQIEANPWLDIAESSFAPRGPREIVPSVYRTLELLAEIGLAERRAEVGGEASFLYCSPRHHHHVICTSCGTVREIDAAFCPGEETTRAVEAATDFQIARHTLDFHGLCADCRTEG